MGFSFSGFFSFSFITESVFSLSVVFWCHAQPHDLRRNLRSTLLLPLACRRSLVRSDQMAQGFVQSGVKKFQGWRLNHLSEATCSSSWLSSWGKMLLLQRGKMSIVETYDHYILSSCHAPLWWDFSILPSARFISVRFPQIQLFSRLSQLHSASSLMVSCWNQVTWYSR